MKKLLIIPIVLTNVYAAVFTINNEKVNFLYSKFMISELIKTYGLIKKNNIVFDTDFKDEEISIAGEKTLSEKDLDLFISAMLSQAGYTYKVLPETKTMNVFSSRDIRFNVVETKTVIDQVPDTYNYLQFMYRLKYIPGNVLVNNLRPLLSRYGRLIEQANTLVIADTGKNIRRLMEIIQVLDTPEYLKSMKEIEEINEKNMKILEKKKSLLQILADNNVIFLIIFSLIGAIIGFGIRGYTMKKIEGGMVR